MAEDDRAWNPRRDILTSAGNSVFWGLVTLPLDER